MKTSITKLILGTAQLGQQYGINNSTGRPSRDEAHRILQKASQLGVHALDTSFAYGDAHGLIRELGPRGHFHITTKFSLGQFSTPAAAWEAAKEIFDQEHTTLQWLLFHDPQEGLRMGPQSLPLGISLYSLDELTAALDLSWVKVVQLPLNLLDQSEKKRQLLAQARRQKVIIQVRSAYLQGLFFMQTLPLQLRPLEKYLSKLRTLAHQYGMTMSELALSYVTLQEVVDHVVFGVDSIVQLEENLGYLKAQLPEGLIQEIHDINVKEVELLNPSHWA